MSSISVTSDGLIRSLGLPTERILDRTAKFCNQCLTARWLRSKMTDVTPNPNGVIIHNPVHRLWVSLAEALKAALEALMTGVPSGRG